jgi:hypothetical protein
VAEAVRASGRGLRVVQGWPWQLQRKLTAVSKLVKQWVRRTPRPKTMKRWQREDASWPNTNHSLTLLSFCCVPAQVDSRRS